MSEAIILYRGRGGVDPESLKPQTITNNGTYTAPVTGNYWVAVVGGGGGGGGGCRNSWNSSQVFYGAGGSRGTLGSGTVFLNAGDQVSMSLGAGGSGGSNNTTVVSNNSRGSNGGAGATSSFGSYQSGSGGTWGGYSWSEHHWVNTNMGWNNVNLGWWNRITSWNNRWVISIWRWDHIPSGKWCGYLIAGSSSRYYCHNCGKSFYIISENDFPSEIQNNQFGGWDNRPVWTNTVNWSNKVVWNNRIVNTTTRCYTSIQQGSWWYTNAANNVSTSGTRTYRGDGGASGSAGNAGFIVIIPPSL